MELETINTINQFNVEVKHVAYRWRKTLSLLLSWRYCYCSDKKEAGRLAFQNKIRKDRKHKLRVQCRKYKHVAHKSQTRRLLLPLGKSFCSKKVRSRNSFTVRKEREMLSNSLTSMLQTCYQQLAHNKISSVSFVEASLLQGGEKQKFLHCQK